MKTTWDEVVGAKRTLTLAQRAEDHGGAEGLPGAPDVFFENLGNGHFRDATAAAGLTDAAGAYGFGVVATDYDGDGARRSVRGQRLEPELPLPQPTPPGARRGSRASA